MTPHIAKKSLNVIASVQVIGWNAGRKEFIFANIQ